MRVFAYVLAAALSVVPAVAGSQGLAQSELPEDNAPAKPEPVPPPRADFEKKDSDKRDIGPKAVHVNAPCVTVKVRHAGLAELQQRRQEPATYWAVVHDRENPGLIDQMKKCHDPENKGLVRQKEGVVEARLTQGAGDVAYLSVPTERKDTLRILHRAVGAALKQLGGRQFWASPVVGDNAVIEITELPPERVANRK